MPYSPLKLIRRYQSISMFGGGIVVTILILIASGLGMTSIVYGYLDGEQHDYLAGMELTLNEIRVSEMLFRNGVTNAQLIWRESGAAPDRDVDAFFDNGERISIKPYPSLVLGVPGQNGSRAEASRYLAFSMLLSRIYAASSINRGQTLEGYHYSLRTGMFALVPNANLDGPALATPEGRARALDGLRIDFGDRVSVVRDGHPVVRWLPPYVNPVSGEVRIRIAAQAHDGDEPFGVLVTEYAPAYLLSWRPEHPSAGMFFVTTADNRLVTSTPGAAEAPGMTERLLSLNIARDDANSNAPVFRNGFVVYRGKLGATGWTIGYALPWTEVVSCIALHAGMLLAATLLTLAVMWTLLVRFHRRVFASVYARSQRVFDSENLCRSVIELAPIGIGLISRADGRFMLASPPLKELVARFGGDLHALSEQVTTQYRAFLASGAADGPLHADLVLAEAGNAHVHLEFIACGARYQNEGVLIAAVADVTANRQLMQKLEEAVRAADSANAAKSSFLAAMSHEIRTPLNVILGNLELLDRSALNASQRSRVQTLRTSATSLLTLVSDILDFSKIEAGAMSVESIEFDVVAVIERELSAFAPIAKAKGLLLFCEIDANSTQRMRSDPTRLAQVFGNLLNNAIKFTDEGRVTARVSTVRSGRSDGDLVIEVEDTGIGIADAQRHKLFKAFSQVDASITRKYGGTGLGLALCDRLVSAMGGRIAVTSTPGAGSCFNVRLPLGMNAAPIDQDKTFDRRALLLISAQAEWRNLALPHLRAWGFEVDIHDRPTRTPAECYAHASAIVLFGDSDAWSHAELDSLGGSAPIVFATPDGPLQPYVAGRTIRVSAYSLGGLRIALTQAMAEAAESAGRRRGRAGPPSVAGGHRPLRVLLADDDTVNGSIFREQLEVLGCAVRMVGMAKGALESLAADAWDVLLLGADLPDMTACTLAEAVHGLGVSCDVVVVTSHSTADEARRYAAAKVESVLTKPVTLAHLRRVLARVSRRRGAHMMGEGTQDQDIEHVTHGSTA